MYCLILSVWWKEQQEASVSNFIIHTGRNSVSPDEHVYCAYTASVAYLGQLIIRRTVVGAIVTTLIRILRNVLFQKTHHEIQYIKTTSHSGACWAKCSSVIRQQCRDSPRVKWPSCNLPALQSCCIDSNIKSIPHLDRVLQRPTRCPDLWRSGVSQLLRAGKTSLKPLIQWTNWISHTQGSWPFQPRSASNPF